MLSKKQKQKQKQNNQTKQKTKKKQNKTKTKTKQNKNKNKNKKKQNNQTYARVSRVSKNTTRTLMTANACATADQTEIKVKIETCKIIFCCY